jgi:hypothetical protein
MGLMNCARQVRMPTNLRNEGSICVGWSDEPYPTIEWCSPRHRMPYNSSNEGSTCG